MFDYFKTVKAFKKDCDNFSTPYDERNEIKSNVTAAEFSKRCHAKHAVRFAACTAVAAAVVLVGTVTFPKLLQPKNANSFEIVVKAANAPEASSDSSYDNTATLLSYMDGSPIRGNFIVKGYNIKSVTYSNTGSGMFIYDFQNNLAKIKPYCTIKIPRSDFTSSNLSQEFKRIWASGTLDKYKNEYFGGKDIDDSKYVYSFDYNDNDVSANIFKKSDLMYCTGIIKAEALNSCTIDGSKQNEMSALLQINDTKYTDIKWNITATFDDGSTQTKSLTVAYNSLGLPYLTPEN